MLGLIYIIAIMFIIEVYLNIIKIYTCIQRNLYLIG